MLKFNDKTPKRIKFNGKNIQELIYNGVTVYLRRLYKATGNFPIILEKAYNENIENYKIYGNTIQPTKLELYKDNLWKNGYVDFSGSYPTVSTDFPNSKYFVVKMRMGSQIKMSVIDDSKTIGRVRFINPITNQIIGTVTSGDNSDFVRSTNNENAGFKNTIFYALQDVDLAFVAATGVINEITSLLWENAIPTPENPVEIENIEEKISIKVNDNITNIYLDEPLNKEDYIEKNNNIYYKTWDKIILDGTNNKFISKSGQTGNVYEINLINAIKGEAIDKVPSILSNQFKAIPWNERANFVDKSVFFRYLNATNCLFRFGSNSIITTLELANNYLKQQYEAGTPVKVYYKLETPIEKQIELPEILLEEEINTVSVETKIQPNYVELEYWKGV